jgi:plastocyanin
MSRRFIVATTCLALCGGAGAFSYAQAPPEVIVRPGDTIQWVGTGNPPHKVRFGANGATPVDDINKILENITPPLANGDGPVLNGTTSLTAKVKDNAEVVGKTFVFTCGIHPPVMLSLQFTVAAKDGPTPRIHKITGEPGLHWHLHVDTTP